MQYARWLRTLTDQMPLLQNARIEAGMLALFEGHTQAQPAAAADADSTEGEYTVSSWWAGWCCCHFKAQCWLQPAWQALTAGHAGAGIMPVASPGSALQWGILDSSAHLRLTSDQFEVCSRPW